MKQFQSKKLTRLVLTNLLFLPSFCYAGNSFQVVNVLQGLIRLLSSDIARLIFVLSIIGVGYGWLYLGRIPRDRAIGAIVGIGIVFSATYIAQHLGIRG